MSDIAERSQRIVADWLKRLPREEHERRSFEHRHRVHGNDGALMTNPARLMQAQLGLWQDYMSLWQKHRASHDGMESEPVIDSASTDRRFKDAAWKDNEVFDFIKQSYL